MKKNDWAILISVFAYSFLFYRQWAGLNFFLFTVLIIVLLLYRNPALPRSRSWALAAAGALLSSFFIFKYGSLLAVTANLVSLAILSALSMHPGVSYLTGIFLTICSAGSSCAFMFIDWAQRKSRELAGAYARPFYVKALLVLIPLLIALVFFLLYRSANPLFYDLTKNISLDFISIGWIFFTLGGLLLMYGFFHNRSLPGISDADSPLELTPDHAALPGFLNGLMRLDTENISGVILFGMLNSLLLIVNLLDLHYLWFDGKLPEGIKHKEFVHEGVGMLITSIIAAIFILLFYFRGGLNFYERNRWIKGLAYAWIVQNVFMVFSTAYRNDMYIAESGLSYKKIGVYVYLLLAVVGLVTTFIKVRERKTNWFLFRVNAIACYILLVIGCFFNWDVIVTDFNIRKHTEEKKELEKYLLLDLSYKNLPQLLSLPDSVSSKDDYKARDYYNALRGVYFHSFRSGLDRKLYRFLDHCDKLEWQSLCLEKQRVLSDIRAMSAYIDSLDYEEYPITSLEPLRTLTGLRSLVLTGNRLDTLAGLARFPLLENLDLERTGLSDLRALPALEKLKRLDISDNDLHTINALQRLPALQELDLSGNPRLKDLTPLFAMKHLRRIIVNAISPEDLETLRQQLPDTWITVKK
ncbi:MAG: DUF4153 domain-containing protein [Bacteroidota bacterium]